GGGRAGGEVGFGVGVGHDAYGRDRRRRSPTAPDAVTGRPLDLRRPCPTRRTGRGGHADRGPAGRLKAHGTPTADGGRIGSRLTGRPVAARTAAATAAGETTTGTVPTALAPNGA